MSFVHNPQEFEIGDRIVVSSQASNLIGKHGVIVDKYDAERYSVRLDFAPNAELAMRGIEMIREPRDSEWAAKTHPAHPINLVESILDGSH